MATKKGSQEKTPLEENKGKASIVIASESQPEIDRLTKALVESGFEVVSLTEALEKANIATSNVQTLLSDAEDKIIILNSRINDLEAEPEPEPETDFLHSEELEINKDGFVPGQILSFDQIRTAQRKKLERKANEK